MHIDPATARFVVDILSAVRRYDETIARVAWHAGKDDHGNVASGTFALMDALGLLRNADTEVSELLGRLNEYATPR